MRCPSLGCGAPETEVARRDHWPGLDEPGAVREPLADIGFELELGAWPHVAVGHPRLRRTAAVAAGASTSDVHPDGPGDRDGSRRSRDPAVTTSVASVPCTWWMKRSNERSNRRNRARTASLPMPLGMSEAVELRPVGDDQALSFGTQQPGHHLHAVLDAIVAVHRRRPSVRPRIVGVGQGVADTRCETRSVSGRTKRCCRKSNVDRPVRGMWFGFPAAGRAAPQ